MVNLKTLSVLAVVGASALLSGCGGSDTAFVQACMKQPNPGNIADDKRRAACGCIENDALAKFADADIRKMMTDVATKVMEDPSKMQSEMTTQMTALASQPEKAKALQDGLPAYMTAAQECAKKLQ